MLRASRSTTSLSPVVHKAPLVTPPLLTTPKGKSLRATLQWWGFVVFIIAMLPVVYVAMSIYLSRPSFKTKLDPINPTRELVYPDLALNTTTSLVEKPIDTISNVMSSKHGSETYGHGPPPIHRQDVRGNQPTSAPNLTDTTHRTTAKPANSLKQTPHVPHPGSDTSDIPDTPDAPSDLLPYSTGWDNGQVTPGTYFIKPYRDNEHFNSSTHSIEPDTQKVTVLISSFKQPTCLAKQLRLWSKCDIVHSIRINWFAGNEDTTLYWPKLDPHGPKVILDELPDRLSHRFWPRRFDTEGVFSVDVDTFYSCSALKSAFALWKRDPQSAVGFHARELNIRRKEVWDESYTPPFLRNSLLITKGGIQHRDVFAQFFSNRYKSQRQQVDRSLTGEDFLMAFVQAIHFDPVIKFVCAGVAQSCHAECTEGKVATLGTRSSVSRKRMLRKLFTDLGDPFVSVSGADELLRLESGKLRPESEGSVHRLFDYVLGRNAIQRTDNCQSKPVSDNKYDCTRFFDPDHVDAQPWYAIFSGPELIILAMYIGLYLNYFSS